jgi:hypothetical protein
MPQTYRRYSHAKQNFGDSQDRSWGGNHTFQGGSPTLTDRDNKKGEQS